MRLLFSRTGFRIILTSAFLTALFSHLLPGKAHSMTEDAFHEKCMRWLKDTYEYVSVDHIIYRYFRNDVHRLRGNYLVKPLLSPATIIGFECEYYELQSHFLALPNPDPFPADTPKPHLVTNASLKEVRVQLAFSACPSQQPWLWIAKEFERGNFNADLPSSCVVLKRGDRFWVSENPTITDTDPKLTQIIVESGQKMWVEPLNLDQ